MAVLNVEKSLLGGEVGGEGDDDVGEVGEARLGMLCLSLHLTGMSLENTKSAEQCSVSTLLALKKFFLLLLFTL